MINKIRVCNWGLTLEGWEFGISISNVDWGLRQGFEIEIQYWGWGRESRLGLGMETGI